MLFLSDNYLNSILYATLCQRRELMPIKSECEQKLD
jgi:hypothetical protein